MQSENPGMGGWKVLRGKGMKGGLCEDEWVCVTDGESKIVHTCSGTAVSIMLKLIFIHIVVGKEWK